MKKLVIKSILSKYFCILLLLMVGCKSQKSIQVRNNNVDVSTIDSLFYPVKLNYTASIVSNVKSNSVKGSIKVNTAKEYFINGYSATYGVELFRMLVYKDSIIFLNKAEKTYFKGSQNDFKYLNIFFTNGIDMVKALTGFNSFENTNFSKDTIQVTDSTVQIQYAFLKSTMFKGNAFYDVNSKLYSQSFLNDNDNIYITYNRSATDFSVISKISFKVNNDFERLYIDLKYTDILLVNYEAFSINIPNGYKMLK